MKEEDKERLLQKRKEIGDTLREERKKRGLSESEFAEMLGVDRTTVNKIENGKWNFTIDYLNLFLSKLNSLLEIKRSIIYDVDDILINDRLYQTWIEYAQYAIKDILKKYPDIKPEEIPDEQFLLFPNGTGEIFVEARGVRIAMPAKVGEFSIITKK